MTNKVVALYSPIPNRKCLIDFGFCINQEGLVVSGGSQNTDFSLAYPIKLSDFSEI